MRVWKVVDSDCPICAEMSEFDGALIELLGFEPALVNFEDVLDFPRLAGFVRANLLNDDGTVDIPIYAIEDDGKFVGAVTGKNSRSELKRKLMQAAEL